MQSLSNGKVIGIGREYGGLYLLKDTIKVVANAVNKDTNLTTLWNLRLRHLSFTTMQHISTIKDQLTNQPCCHICPQAKQSRPVFYDSSHKSSTISQLLHVDVWGPYKTPTYDRKQYFVTIVDDYSRFSWVCLIHSKVEVHFVLKDFLLMINTQFGMKVKVLRSDNGIEFMNTKCRELFSLLAIVHQSSCAYTPQQNGVVERKHMHILNTARALKFQGNIPTSYWGHCVKAAIYLINKLPTSVLQGKSPHELLYGTKPQLDHLRVFCCLCFVSILPRSDKFAPRAKKVVFMGYADTQKGYRVQDLESNSFFVSRDVTFMEDQFPFKQVLNSHYSIIQLLRFLHGLQCLMIMRSLKYILRIQLVSYRIMHLLMSLLKL